ncbi:PREDICTED: ERC protein 2-like, partial [Priapulus caudatus]|uniref:ERC protein 2-like n=1 Tax=Priapulus caudatus TaxID=37621 RepID=A0ABM1F6Z9_PRICU
MRSGRGHSEDSQGVIEALQDKARLLEAPIERMNSDKKQAEKHLIENKENLEMEKIDNARLKTLLDNERSKVRELDELVSARQNTGTTELEELLSKTREEKGRAEARVANLQEALAHSQNEATKLKDKVFYLEEELQVIKNNTNTALTNAEYTISRLETERTHLQNSVEHLNDHAVEMEQRCLKHMEDKRECANNLKEMKREMAALKQRS